MKPLTILVADDEKEFCVLLQQWLTTAGHDVIAVMSGTEACEVLQQRAFDLVITDMLMPDGDGVDLITEIKRVQPTLRILAMSGGGRYTEGRDYLELAKGVGAHAVVLKPFTWLQLQKAMAAVMSAQPEHTT